MKRGPRYSPASRRGQRRTAAFVLGALAAFSLVWQQQTTLASFVDTEYATASFDAGKLGPITPKLDPGYGSVAVSWKPAQGDWASPQYALSWSENSGGVPSAKVYSGTSASAELSHGTGAQSPAALLFSDVAVGASHACGIARGSIYCWGTSAAGGLGLGTTTSTSVPQRVGGVLVGQQVLEVTAGTNFTCARTSSGAAFCWGEGSNGQLGNGKAVDANTPQAVSVITDVSGISAGTQHACAVSAGRAYCWGLGTDGRVGDGAQAQRTSPVLVTQAANLLAGRTVSQIAAGGGHSCAVADGRAFCWGLNASGQLGNDGKASSLSPVAVSLASGTFSRAVTSIGAGGAHTCAIAAGSAYCWGSGGSGQLGNAKATSSAVPVAVTATAMGAHVTAISAGDSNSCAISSGRAFCWGAGASGQLGNGSTIDAASPVAVGGTVASRAVTAISAGTNVACAAGGAPAACWGAGALGQMGDGDTGATNVTPSDVTLNGAVCPSGSVRQGADCSLSEGTDYYFRLAYGIGSWVAPGSEWVRATTKTRGDLTPSATSATATAINLGWGAPPELGDSYPEYTLQRSVSAAGSAPATLTTVGLRAAVDRGGVLPSQRYTKLAAGLTHTCGIVGGALYCWGSNASGELGLGNTSAVAEPTRVTAFNQKSVTDVAVGDASTCAVADGAAYCWGRNSDGRLGTGDTTSANAPRLVANQAGYTVIEVAVGAAHSCAITSDHKAWCWGSNVSGQLGTGTQSDALTPQPVGAGDRGTAGIDHIAAGGNHTCAIAASRSYCWGLNDSGELGNGGTTTALLPKATSITNTATAAVTAISAGSNHSCSVVAGRAFCWGDNGSGRAGIGSRVTRVVVPTAVSGMSGDVTAIVAGTSTTCAIAGGLGYCWGLGSSGQLGNAATTGTNRNAVPVARSGGLGGSTLTAITTGSTHSCGVFDGLLYCWGDPSGSALLGDRDTTRYSYPVLLPVDSQCGGGAAMGDGTCTLAPATTYYYRVTYTIDGLGPQSGAWTGLRTAG